MTGRLIDADAVYKILKSCGGAQMINFIFRVITAIFLAFSSYTVGYNQGFFDGIKNFAKRITDDVNTFERIMKKHHSERKEE